MQDDWGYIYTGADGLLNYVSGSMPALQPGATFSVTPEQAQALMLTTTSITTNATPPVLSSTSLWTDVLGRECSIGAPVGHEAAGPQATDAKATSDAMCDVLQGWATALCNESRGRTMDDAVSALHRQHTRDGRPSRFIPEAE